MGGFFLGSHIGSLSRNVEYITNHVVSVIDSPFLQSWAVEEVSGVGGDDPGLYDLIILAHAVRRHTG